MRRNAEFDGKTLYGAPVNYRSVNGHPGYEVGDDGTVWSRMPRGKRGDRRLLAAPRRLRPDIRRYGHQVVLLSSPVPTRYYVHCLVLEAFVGPCPPGMECCHEDGNAGNNRLSNLRWDSHAANGADMVRHGRAAKGTQNTNAKLDEEKVRMARSMRADGASYPRIGKAIGVTAVSARAAVIGATWKHVGAE